MSLNPSAIVLDPQGQMFVAIDDFDTEGVLLIPCSFAHRRVVYAIPADWECHVGQIAVHVEAGE